MGAFWVSLAGAIAATGINPNRKKENDDFYLFQRSIWEVVLFSPLSLLCPIQTAMGTETALSGVVAWIILNLWMPRFLCSLAQAALTRHGSHLSIPAAHLPLWGSPGHCLGDGSWLLESQCPLISEYLRSGWITKRLGCFHREPGLASRVGSYQLCDLF